MKILNRRFDRFGQDFHYQLHRRPGDGLIVFFPGLRSRMSKALEYYNRLTWSPSCQVSCLFVADPALSLHESVRGSWFQGGKDFFAIESVADDIRTISEEFRFSETRTVLYGSSQGGFAALAIGAFLTDAKVLSECPQTDVRLFNNKDDTSRAAKFCYGVDNIEDVPSEYDSRLNIAALYKNRGFIPKSRIVVKESDTHAINLHIRPLQDAIGSRTDVQVFSGDLGEGGHSALPKEVIIDEISSLLAV